MRHKIIRIKTICNFPNINHDKNIFLAELGYVRSVPTERWPSISSTYNDTLGAPLPCLVAQTGASDMS